MKLYLYLLIFVVLTTAPFAVFSQQAAELPAVQEPAYQVADSVETYVYETRGRRDPFTPLIRKEQPPPEIQLQRRPEQLRGPLERYEIGQLRLIAVMVVQGVPRAMVAAPDGKSYSVRVNDYVGLNGGRVTNIQTRLMAVDETGMRVEKHPDRIVVEETGVDTQSGRIIKQQSYIVL